MGSCVSSNKSVKEVCQGNKALSDSNIQLLKFLSLYFINKKQPVMAVKIINIKSITKNYYHAVEIEREAAVERSHLLESEDYTILEQTLIAESRELQKTKEVLKQIASSFASGLFSLNHSIKKQTFKYSEDKELVYRYKELKNICFEYNRKGGSGIRSLATRINNGARLTKEQESVLLDISRVTSHVANNPSRRMNYCFESLRNYTHRSYQTYSNLQSISSNRKNTLNSKNRLPFD